MKYFTAALLAGAVLLTAHGFRTAPPPLEHTFDSPEAVAAAVLDAFSRRDSAALGRMALDEREFGAHVWPGLPASRPERNLPFDYVWNDLHAKSRAFLATNLRQPLPPGARLVRVTFSGTTTYDRFSVHRDSRLTVVDAAGREHSLRLFGSVLQMGARYKVFSYVTD